MKLTHGREALKPKEWLAICLGLVLVFALITPSLDSIKIFLLQRGYTALSEEPKEKLVQFATDMAKAPINFVTANHHLPTVRVDITYPNWSLLVKDRETAFNQGFIPVNRSEVKARIYSDNRVLDAKVRLQGDLLDHVNGVNRWSLKFKVDNKQALFSSRRFALISPHVRINHGPTLFAETMKLAGFDIISPRYTPVNVIVNGEEWGVMYHEQGFGQDLLAINKRTEGLIVRLDLAEQKDTDGKVHRIFKPRVLQRNTIVNSTALGYQRQIALSLIGDFINGKRDASDVFDSQRLGQYLAVIDTWGAWHGLAWNNWRWYYNPHTAKLEPIQSDVNVSPAKHSLMMKPPSHYFLLSKKMLEDKEVRKHYDSSIDTLGNLLTDSTLQLHLTKVQEPLLKALHSGLPLTTPFNPDNLQAQMVCLQSNYKDTSCINVSNVSSDLHQQMDSMTSLPLWDLNTHYVTKPSNNLIIRNPERQPLRILGLTGWTDFDERSSLEEANYSFPLELASGESFSVTLPKHIKTVELRASTTGQSMGNYQFRRNIEPMSFLPRPADTNKVNQYAFIQQEKEAWRIPAGNWVINDYLITPENWTLYLEQGANIEFGKNAGIMVFGQLEVEGTTAKPVKLSRRGQIPNWSGLSLFNANNETRSRIRNLHISYAGRPDLGLWQPRGATYLVGGKLSVDGLFISDNVSEDALNIVNSDVDISHLSIKEALSDAFDCDYCTGKIYDSEFANIGKRSGGDGLDVSGSDLDVSGINFSDIRDKAVSVGEESLMRLKDIEFARVNFGLVAKDASAVEAESITAKDVSHYALMSYTKKPLFGSATLKALEFQCSGCEKKIISELGSELNVNGVVIASQALDVGKLYNTVMKSDKPL
ncbi:CotH kinase family protein [Vibrio tetraodonis]|uniref:CotH kinase family protein n=1 Tax=Vibrio tetraodonis TaxID=2231647 RepID=UPI000E0B2B69|nr:CotH kinase family protein [Vibrio tetraodonis]